MPVLLSEIEKSYFAALIDGEGTVGTWRYARPPGRSGVWQSRIAVTMTHEGVVRDLHVAFGGSIFVVEKKGKPHYKTQWRWTVASRKALHVCRVLRRYMRIKGEAMDAILEHYGVEPW